MFWAKDVGDDVGDDFHNFSVLVVEQWLLCINTIPFILCFVNIYFMFFTPPPFSEKKEISLILQVGGGTIFHSPVAIHFMLNARV